MDRIESLLKEARDRSHELWIAVKMGRAFVEIYQGPGVWKGEVDLDGYDTTTEAICDALEEALADLPDKQVAVIKHKWPLEDDQLVEEEDDTHNQN
jgi:hypothetical protein